MQGCLLSQNPNPCAGQQCVDEQNNNNRCLPGVGRLGSGGRSSVPFLATASLERGSTSLACLLSLQVLVASGRGRAFPGR